MWTWITILSAQAPIKDDLQQRVHRALENAGHDWAVSDFAGRDGVLVGRAVSQADQKRAFDVARSVWGVRIIDNEAQLVAKVDSYLWSATASNETIRLSGTVPDAETQERLAQVISAKFPSAKIDDGLKISQGLSNKKQWLTGVYFGIAQLARLKTGTLSFDNTSMSIGGEAKSFADYKSVRQTLREQVPKNVVVAKADITPPIVSPYTWSVKRSARQVVLAGHVPGEGPREQLFEQAKKRFPELAIVDRMETAAGAASGWASAAILTLIELSALEEGEVKISDHTVSLTGKAADEETADRVKAQLQDGLPKNYTTKIDINFPETGPPIINPFVTSVDVGSGSIRLYGYVASEAARKALLTEVAARFPGLKVSDDLQLGSGKPEGWNACLLAGLSGLERLGAGTIQLKGEDLIVAGTTKDERIAEELPGAVRAAANRACLSETNITLNVPPEPQLTWRVSFDGDNTLLLDGEVPDKATKQALRDGADIAFAGKSIVDQMRVVDSYAKNWRVTAEIALNLLARLRKGEAILDGQDLLVRGEAKDTSVAGAVRDQLKHKLGTGYTGRDELEIKSDAMIWAELEAKRKKAAAEAAAEKARLDVLKEAEARRLAETEARLEAERAARILAEREAEEAKRRAEDEATRLAREAARRKAEQEEDARRQQAALAAKQKQRQAEADRCQDLLRSAAGEGTIRFKFASDKLDAKSHPTLNRLATIVSECPKFQVEISGHTDNNGTQKRNQALSERRAKSVIDYLVSAGVERDQVFAVGYGESRPIAPNTTEANRAKNRRIEFEVKVD